MHLIFLVIAIFFQKIFTVKTLDLLILHNNDMHSRFEETSRNSGTCNNSIPRTKSSKKQGCVGGFARTAHMIRKYRKLAEEGGRKVLFLNAGDTYTGTPWFSVHKWKIASDFLNALKPDAASLGNHEFDLGVSNLASLVEAINFPIVAANLKFDKEPTLNRITKSVVLEVQGQKIGIVGHLTPDTKIMSSPGQVIFLDVVESMKKETEELDKNGVKIIIIVGHSGYDTDMKIAKEVPLADVVVGGHTNTFLWNGPQPDSEEPEDPYPKVVVQKSGKKVPVVQAYAYTKYLGSLNVNFNSKGDLVSFSGQPILLDTHIPQDSDILEKLEKYRPEILALEKEIVGKASVLLDSSNKKCRVRECNLANMVTDSFAYYMANQHAGSGWTGTPIALINGGGIRNTIDPSLRNGNITRGELMGVLPFENQVITLTLSGSDLLKTLEIGARSNGETSRGEFLQSSGLHVVYDFRKHSFSRVVSVKVRCGNCRVPEYEDLDEEQMYNVVTCSFLSNGGDDHYVLKNAGNKKVQDLTDLDTVAWYLGKQSLVYPEEQGRITVINFGGRKVGSTVPFLILLTSFLLS